jgi:hypothetical protein
MFQHIQCQGRATRFSRHEQQTKVRSDRGRSRINRQNAYDAFDVCIGQVMARNLVFRTVAHTGCGSTIYYVISPT